MVDITWLLVLLVVIAVLLRLDFVFYLVYLGVGTYALARWWTNTSMAGLRVERDFADHMFLGQDTVVKIDIRNTRWWPVPWLRFDETVPTNLMAGRPIRHAVSLGPKERRSYRYQITGRVRGYYEVGPLTLSTGDLFGFSQVQGRVVTGEHITVYPRVIPISRVRLDSRAPYGTIASRQRIFADPTRVGGKREYQRGDPLRAIDWKSSAHSMGLQVKKYDPAVSLDSMIILNLRADDYSRQQLRQASEWGIVVAASLGNYLADRRQSVGLGSNGRDSLTEAAEWVIAPRSGRQHLMKLLEWLARVQLSQEVQPFPAWLPRATAGLAWGTVVIAVSPIGDEPTCWAMHGLVRAGLTPVLLITEPRHQLGPVAERARRLGFTALMAADEHDLSCL